MPCISHQVHHHDMGYISVLSLHSWLHKDTSFEVWHLTDIPLHKGFWTFLAFEDGLRCRFRHYNHPFKGWKLVLETVYFEGWCTSKQVEKVLKVKSSGEVSLVVPRMTCCEVQVVRRQFRASGRPDDHLICTLHSAYTTRMLQPIWIQDTQNTRK